MCGVTAFWRRGAALVEGDAAVIQAMTDRLQHRGPDAGDTWLDPHAGFAVGHRRLSIIDLSASGAQPMHSACGRYVIAYNGELYNAGELRAELGLSLRGHSDTEVLLEACATWGVEPTVARCIGMFAFALWDRKARTLTLVRDRVGVKPLYWVDTGDVVLVGSELKSLRAFPDWRPQLDRASVAAFMAYGFLPEGQCIYAGVRQVGPGAIVTISQEAPPRETVYWALGSVIEPGRTSHRDDIEAVNELIEDSVRRCLVSDAPLGAFLSGGIDSSLVSALMAKHASIKPKTISIGFDQKGFNEAPFARAIAQHLGTDHTEYYVSGADVLAHVEKIPDIYDEPFADHSQLPTYVLARLAREQVTVALTGDGGDEVFFGYYHHWRLPEIMGWTRRTPRAGRQFVASAGLALLPIASAVLHKPRLMQQAEKGLRLLSAETFAELYDRESRYWHDARVVTAASDSFSRIGSGEAISAHLGSDAEEAAYRDFVNLLPARMLTKVDRATMAAGLEARVPLLDHRIIERAWTLAPEAKLTAGRSKRVLRDLLVRHVPAALFERPKAGFAMPLADWFRGDLRPWAEDLLAPSMIRRYGLLDETIIDRYLQEHMTGRVDRRNALWAACQLQAWMGRWSEGVAL